MVTLIPFEEPTNPVTVLAHISRTESTISVHYHLSEVGKYITHPQGVAVRGGELWRSTCFELFLPNHTGGYREWNFSGGGGWECYDFLSYREGRSIAHVSPPLQQLVEEERALHFTITVPLVPFCGSVGVSVILADRVGDRFYFAPVHPKEAPDFHHELSMNNIPEKSGNCTSGR